MKVNLAARGKSQGEDVSAETLAAGRIARLSSPTLEEIKPLRHTALRLSLSLYLYLSIAKRLSSLSFSLSSHF